MAKFFEVELKENLEELIARTKNTAKEEGLTFDGDTNGGTIKGRGFEGVYKITDGKVAVTINKKPMLVPWLVVESKLKSFLG